jgi:hypothetical protein
LPSLSEKPMHIAAAHPAIDGYRAIAAAIGEMQNRPRAVRPRGAAGMDFVTGERNPVLGTLSMYRRQHFVAGEVRLDVEQT